MEPDSQSFQQIEDSDSQSNQQFMDSDHDVDDISGTKCRAPFSHDWGGLQYYNAMILSVDPLNADQEPTVRNKFFIIKRKNYSNIVMRNFKLVARVSCKLKA